MGTNYLLNNDAISKINISLQSIHDWDKDQIKDYFNDLNNYIKRNEKTHIYLRNWALDIKDRNNLEDELRTIFPTATFKDGELLNKLVHYSIAEKFEWPNMDANECDKSTCLGGKNQIGILSDGTVILCCLDTNGDTNLGNIFDEDLESIISSEKYIKAVTNMPYLELCKKCTYRLRFKK